MNQILVCHSGRGEVLLGGAWRMCSAGQAYVTPSGILHAYRAAGPRTWGLCWVIYTAVEGEPGLVLPSGPLLVPVDPRPLLSAIEGLYRESIGAREAALMHHWVELIHLHVCRIVRPLRGDGRLARLWEAADRDLARPWSLASMAREAHVSGEHLRRLCRREFGCSPVRRLAQLRMERAVDLLSTTDQKVEAIAASVGYENAFAFSTAFKRCFGASPSVYRQKPAPRIGETSP